MQLDRLEWHLYNWRISYYVDDPAKKLGFSSQACYMPREGKSFADEVADGPDGYIASAATEMDAMIDSLPPAQGCAIHHKWLHAVYKLRDIEEAYMMALDNLMMMADRRGLV